MWLNGSQSWSVKATYTQDNAEKDDSYILGIYHARLLVSQIKLSREFIKFSPSVWVEQDRGSNVSKTSTKFIDFNLVTLRS